MSKLFVVPTPVGNLKDITIRAIETLNSVKTIVCEDTRRTLILLNHYQITGKKLISYFSPKEIQKIPEILQILKKENAALVVDAGMPVISDPGYFLIKACLEANIEVEVLPGPSAFLTALVGSGIVIDKFLFLGFLPKHGLKNFFSQYKDLKVTLVFYESAKRIFKTVEIMEAVFKNGQIVIAREISKIYEEYIRGQLTTIKSYLKEKKLKGEITVIFRQNF